MILVGSALALLCAFELVGPLRAVVAVRCAVDRFRNGSMRSVGNLSVSLPNNWCEDHARAADRPPTLKLVRIPRSRSSGNTLATIRRYRGEFDDDKGRSSVSLLKWSTPYYGGWEVDSLIDADFGGEPGYEIRFKRSIAGSANQDIVSSDFIAPQRHAWVSCSPMSPIDLAECRGIILSIKTE